MDKKTVAIYCVNTIIAKTYKVKTIDIDLKYLTITSFPGEDIISLPIGSIRKIEVW